MDPDSLKAFLAVAECQSFSLAAEVLHLTQPAVSKRIAALEAHLCHTLFDRLGRDIRLTEAGERLLPQAQKIIRSIEETERNIRELSGEIAGTLRVATSHHIGLHHLPPVLRAFAYQHRQVNLQFEFLDSEQAHDRVAHGDCELAVVTLAPKMERPLVGEVIWRDPLVFVVAKDHSLNGGNPASLAQLAKSPAILPDLNTYTGRMVKNCFDNKGLTLTLSMATNYLETIKMMVSVGLGWSVLPKSMVDEHLREISVKGAKLERKLGVVTHSKRTLSNAAAAFYKVLRDEAITSTPI
ncbi:DNA-binding transcriptional regulator, LysR family [Alteromonadaceae bacterium Bs31]|nr:DNA-binding transcriptional regulator, LysR family [Alteromonadaceae bacterium Bs31]